MATAFCSLNMLGSGLSQLNDYNLKKKHTIFTRQVVPLLRILQLGFLHIILISSLHFRSCLHSRRLFGASLNAEKVSPGTNGRVEVKHCPQAFPSNNASVNEEDKEENISKATLIWRAIKLPIYFVAFIPLTVSWLKLLFLL